MKNVPTSSQIIHADIDPILNCDLEGEGNDDLPEDSVSVLFILLVLNEEILTFVHSNSDTTYADCATLIQIERCL